jgi:hypothetical protein
MDLVGDMQTINNNVFPKGGFSFKDENNVTHTSNSWPGVIAKVQRFRERAGVPIGDVAAEVIAQACRVNPGLCRTENAVYAETLAKTTLKTRVLKWITALREHVQVHPLVFVPDDERRNRANVCATCPGNNELPGGCQSCVKALNELRKATIGKRLLDARLHACGFLGEDLPTAVHLDSTRVANNDLPAHCWRKTQI